MFTPIKIGKQEERNKGKKCKWKTVCYRIIKPAVKSITDTMTNQSNIFKKQICQREGIAFYQLLMLYGKWTPTFQVQKVLGCFITLENGR